MRPKNEAATIKGSNTNIIATNNNREYTEYNDWRGFSTIFMIAKIVGITS